MSSTPFRCWEIAFIYAFAVFFDRSDIAPIHTIPNFTPKTLEEALSHEADSLLDRLMCTFLSNALNRKKLIESNSSTRPLIEYINSKLRSGDFELGYNPVTAAEGFTGLPAHVKLNILYSLVEWQLQDSTAIRAIVDRSYATNKKGNINPLIPTPLGYDRRKRAYWQFGESPYLWRERIQLKSGCEWEAVCRDVSDLQKFADDLLKSSKNHKEKDLANTIKHTLIPELEEKQRMQELKDRANARREAARLALETPRALPPRERRKPTRYNYNEESLMALDDVLEQSDNKNKYNVDNLDSDDNDGEDGERKTRQQVTTKRPTRSSGRLHGNDSITSYMDVDQQPQQDQYPEAKLVDTSMTWPTPPD